MWASVQITSGCPAPSSRSKHAVCVSEEIGRKRIYVLGGRSANLPLKDFWKFDPEQQVWEEIRTRGHRPPCLQEHTMVSWKNHLYVFGGEIGFASTGETPLWIFEINTSVWRKTGGSSSHQPSGRRGHSAVVYDDAMFIYGGYQDLRGSSSELWTLDLASENWTMILIASNLDQPPPRHSHSCVIYDGAMWIYGGLTDLQPRGDFWKWDFDMQEWTRIKVQKGPGELFGHAAVQVMGYMYIFGGERVGVSVNELWRYHFATDTWERIAAEGAQPPPKCRHVAIANPLLPENGMVMQMKRDNSSGETSFFRVDEDFDTNIRKKPHPPKSLSMCFGQQPQNHNHHHNNQDHNGSRKRTFKFRVHPVSRLCSKSTSSDDEDEEEDYLVGYSHSSGQVNLRSLRERISSSRLVRSISSGSYSILHNQSNADTRQFELERLMESKTIQQNNQCRPRLTIQKSQSSDAVLESDCDKLATAKQLRPRSEVLTESTQSGVPIWVENPNATLSPTSWSDGHQFYSHSNFSHYRPGGLSIVRAGEVHNGSCTTPASRPSRLSYDGPLSTVKDVEEENSENADEANMLVEPKQNNGDNSNKDPPIASANATEMLVDLDVPEVDQERARYPSRFASSYTMSDLNSQTTTPSIESRGMPHSMSHSSGYHSFTDDEGDNHREFAGCLNSSSTTRKGFQRDRELELKTFTPTETERPPTVLSNIGKERARSWDRSYQRKPINRHSFSPGGSITPTSFCGAMDTIVQEKASTMTSPTSRVPHNEPSPSERRSRPTSRNSHNPKVEFYPWNLCLYLFGGPEQGAPGIYRQPISIWKLYV